MTTLFIAEECIPFRSKSNHFIYYGAWPFDTKLREESRDYVGQKIQLGVGGGVAEIKGIESHCIPTLRKGASVGILVEHKPPEYVV